MKHKRIRMKWLCLKEASLATWSCSICNNYVQFGDRNQIAYCNGETQEFVPFNKYVEVKIWR